MYEDDEKMFHHRQERLVLKTHRVGETEILLSCKASMSESENFVDHKHSLNFKKIRNRVKRWRRTTDSEDVYLKQTSETSEEET